MLLVNYHLITRRMRELKSSMSQHGGYSDRFVNQEFLILWTIANCSPSFGEGRRLALAFPEYFLELDNEQPYYLRFPVPLSVLHAQSNAYEGDSIFDERTSINGEAVQYLISEHRFMLRVDASELEDEEKEDYVSSCKEYPVLPLTGEAQSVKEGDTFTYSGYQYLVVWIDEDAWSILAMRMDQIAMDV